MYRISQQRTIITVKDLPLPQMEPAGRRPFGRPRLRWEDQTMRDLSIVGGVPPIWSRIEKDGGELCVRPKTY